MEGGRSRTKTEFIEKACLLLWKGEEANSLIHICGFNPKRNI